MTTLGTYPSHRYNKSWIAQRMFNSGVPEWAYVRKCPISLGQQLINPIALDIQDTYQQLAKERYNQFVSTADISTLDTLYRADLLYEMEFNYTESATGERIYTPPTVYATISGTEYQITQAEDNNIKTLSEDNIPSRIEDGDLSYSYEEVIPETVVSGLSSVSPNNITVPGHLYITLKNNSTWEERTSTHIYYSKIHITGTTRKGTEVTESVPLRYNGTFKTINEWSEVDSVFVSYLDSTATICVESLPHNRESYLDSQNIFVPSIGGERFQFTSLGTRSFGSTFKVDAYTLASMNAVRVGLDDKDIVYEIELLDESSSNVTLNDYIHRPNSRFIYAISDDKFYVYDVNLPFPDITNMTGDSEDAKIDLESDKWILTRGEIAKIYTHNLDLGNVPWRVRWTVLDPDGNEYYMGINGTFWPTTIDAWIDNEQWDQQLWREQEIEFTVSKTGEYIIGLEAEYYDELTNTSKTLTSKFMFFLPVITPEAEFSLPSGLQNPTDIALDSDHNIWLLLYDGVHLLNIYYDYFIADYERNRIYMKEEYSSVRIVI